MGTTRPTPYLMSEPANSRWNWLTHLRGTGSSQAAAVPTAVARIEQDRPPVTLQGVQVGENNSVSADTLLRKRPTDYFALYCPGN